MPENKNIGMMPNLLRAANPLSFSRVVEKATIGPANAMPTSRHAGNANKPSGDLMPPKAATTARYTPDAIAILVAIHNR